MVIEKRYDQLLGFHAPRQISRVDLKMQEQRGDIEIEYADEKDPCPECGAICPKHDDRKGRSWRHPDKVQFATD
jgi:transposase